MQKGFTGGVDSDDEPMGGGDMHDDDGVPGQSAADKTIDTTQFPGFSLNYTSDLLEPARNVEKVRHVIDIPYHNFIVTEDCHQLRQDGQAREREAIAADNMD